MSVKADEHIYINADRTRVVPGDSTEAAFLLVATGDEIPDEVARQYGLIGSKREREQAEAAAGVVTVPSTAADEPQDEEGGSKSAALVTTEGTKSESEAEATPKTPKGDKAK